MKVPAYRYLPQDNPARPPASQTSGDRWTVCGSLCTSGDILVKNLPLEGLMTGDLLVFDRIGAYSVTEGIYLFLSRQLPVVLTYTQKQGLSLVRDAFPTDILNDGFAMELYQAQMDELLELLEDIKPTVDFRTCTGLIDDGYLDSFDILSIVSELNDAFGIEISPVDIIPENFNSAQALWDMVERLKAN